MIIAKNIDKEVPSGNKSHQELLHQMASIAQVEEIANMIYLDLLEDLDNPTLADVKKGLEEKGYVINQYTTNLSSITDIILSKTSITLEVGESETIGVTYVGSDEMFSYYVEINGNNYKMILENDTVKINKEKTKVDTNLDNGGWDRDIKGFWCAKYEASQGTGSTLQFVPNVSSWSSQSIGTQYATAINATYGYTVLNANSDGIRSFMYSHMMKNSEWGAVAYLTHSKYGRNGKEIDINNSYSFITGNGGGSTSASSVSGTTNAYNTAKGVKASTTGNVYGIYDMSGGAWERVALFNSKDDNGRFSSYGWDTIGNIAGIKNTVNSETKLTSGTSTKYATKYDNKTTSSNGNSIIYTAGKVGDATKEVNRGEIEILDYSGVSTNNYNWFGDNIDLVESMYPFAARGGICNGRAGVFYMSWCIGNDTWNNRWL